MLLIVLVYKLTMRRRKPIEYLYKKQTENDLVNLYLSDHERLLSEQKTSFQMQPRN